MAVSVTVGSRELLSWIKGNTVCSTESVDSYGCLCTCVRDIFPACVTWIKLSAPVLILFSVLQLELTLALCILYEWPPRRPNSPPRLSPLCVSVAHRPPPLSFVLMFFSPAGSLLAIV